MGYPPDPLKMIPGTTPGEAQRDHSASLEARLSAAEDVVRAARSLRDGMAADYYPDRHGMLFHDLDEALATASGEREAGALSAAEHDRLVMLFRKEAVNQDPPPPHPPE